jgi:hypothetical protein
LALAAGITRKYRRSRFDGPLSAVLTSFTFNAMGLIKTAAPVSTRPRTQPLLNRMHLMLRAQHGQVSWKCRATPDKPLQPMWWHSLGIDGVCPKAHSELSSLQLDPASNPALPYIHMLAGVGAAFIVAFFVYFASDPFGYLYR